MNIVDNIRNELYSRGLKLTMQRIVIYEVLLKHTHHPTADDIIEEVSKKHPNISQGTIYKTLELFVNVGLIRKIKSEDDVMRYDPNPEKHHHIYIDKSDEIIDYFDEELDDMLREYFKRKKIPNIAIKDLSLQINGEYAGYNK